MCLISNGGVIVIKNSKLTSAVEPRFGVGKIPAIIIKRIRLLKSN